MYFRLKEKSVRVCLRNSEVLRKVVLYRERGDLKMKNQVN